MGSTRVRGTVVGGRATSELGVVIEDGSGVGFSSLNVVSHRASTGALVGKRAEGTLAANEAFSIASERGTLVNRVEAGLRGRATSELFISMERLVTREADGNGVGASTEDQLLAIADALVEFRGNGEVGIRARFVAFDNIGKGDGFTIKFGVTVPQEGKELVGSCPVTSVHSTFVNIDTPARFVFIVERFPGLGQLGDVVLDVNVDLDFVVLVLENHPSAGKSEITTLDFFCVEISVIQVGVDGRHAVLKFG